MIVITGAAGFIGSYLTGKLNQQGYADLILVDRFNSSSKTLNLAGKKYIKLIDRDNFFEWLKKNYCSIDFIFHLGAITDTVSNNNNLYQIFNLQYSQKLWNICAETDIPLLYASSAATYGNGDSGFSDCHKSIKDLKPLNRYGWSKHEFDVWALNQSSPPPFWTGLKFFNVYGPNEYHKGRMASVVLHAFNTVKESGRMKLFRSHNEKYRDGEQSRDFIFVDDVAEVMIFFMNNQNSPGIYNVGTGKARSFMDLSYNVFKNLHKDTNISFIDTPSDIRKRYQYFTEADINKLRNIEYKKPFTTLEEGIELYIKKFLLNDIYY